MDERFKRCLDEQRIVKIAVQPDLIEKELAAAEFDLKSAEESGGGDNFKWATVQAYYSMFHSTKALVLSKGYREKSHLCLSIALKALFVDEGIIEMKHFTHFRDCMNLRQDADYGLVYSEASAEEVVKWAKEFLEVARKVIVLPE
ncbi:HEPN domain protein [uncultured archaeon]|nr:HEPN domain protein [uncultured archaeon]